MNLAIHTDSFNYVFSKSLIKVLQPIGLVKSIKLAELAKVPVSAWPLVARIRSARTIRQPRNSVHIEHFIQNTVVLKDHDPFAKFTQIRKETYMICGEPHRLGESGQSVNDLLNQPLPAGRKTRFRTGLANEIILSEDVTMPSGKTVREKKTFAYGPGVESTKYLVKVLNQLGKAADEL